MSQTCPLPTPAQQRHGKIKSRIEQDLLRTVHAALRDAAEQARADMSTADLEMAAPPADYFVALVHQNLFCTMCKADPETFRGGRADIALPVLRNGHNIAHHYWGATNV